MKKHYEVHKINNLHDLHWEQKRVRHAYKKMELNWMNAVLSPDAIASYLIRSLFSSPSKSSSKNKRRDSNSNPLNQKCNISNSKKRSTIFKGSDTLSTKQQATKSRKKNYKTLGKTFLIWQLGSLIAFLGLNIVNHRRKKRKSSRAVH